MMGEIERHALASHPEECCGVLLGPIPPDFDRQGRSVEAQEHRPLANAWESGGRGTRYQIDPALILKIEKEFRGTGRGIVGWYHSHPDLPAWPSPFDLSRAWPCYSYMILSVFKDELRATRSWIRSEGGNDFVPEALEIL